MPTYNFRDKITGNIIEQFMSIKAMEQFLIDNPQYETYHDTPPQLGDAIRMGLKKPDDAFRDKLKDIKNKHRRSVVNTF